MENIDSNELKNLPNLSGFIDNLTGKFFMNKKELEDKLNNWKNQKLNIGVVGVSGCGKSTLINSIRGLFPNDPGAAKTDVKECTQFPTPYPFPKNENIVIWDLPGISPSFPLESYLERITCQKNRLTSEGYVSIKLPIEYDCFLFCSATRFSEADFNLEMKIFEKGKNFVFVHLKFDQDIDGRESKMGILLNEKKDIDSLMEEIREDIRKKSNDALAGKKRPEIFIISAKRKKLNGITKDDNTEKYEFEKLIEWINECFSEEKRNAYILSVMPSGRKSIQRKCEVLRKQIKYAALLSGAGGFIPVPGASLAIDTTILAEQVITYIYQLNISKKNIESIIESFGVRYEDLGPILDSNRFFRSVLDFIGSFGIISFNQGLGYLIKLLLVPLGEFLTEYFSKYIAANTAEEISKILFPGIGSLIGGCLSAGSTYFVLKTTLDSFEKGLLDIFDYCIKNSNLN